jgi:hypothetical protein
LRDRVRGASPARARPALFDAALELLGPALETEEDLNRHHLRPVVDALGAGDHLADEHLLCLLLEVGLEAVGHGHEQIFVLQLRRGGGCGQGDDECERQK